MENNAQPPQPIEPPATNEPFKMTRETAESIKVLIDSVAPYVERHMEASRAAMLQDRSLTLDAARQERDTSIQAADNASRRTFLLLGTIVVTIAGLAVGFAWLQQWQIAEKLAIGVLSFAMGARVAAK